MFTIFKVIQNNNTLKHGIALSNKWKSFSGIQNNNTLKPQFKKI